jgi:hypothetical protein
MSILACVASRSTRRALAVLARVIALRSSMIANFFFSHAAGAARPCATTPAVIVHRPHPRRRFSV